MSYTVYKHVLNGKIYIGITRQEPKKRWLYGLGYKECPRFYNAIKKYGWQNVEHEILFTGLTKEQAEQKEIELIAFYKSNDRRYGYNIDNGGNCAGKCSEDHKKKVSEKTKGKNNPFYGKRHTQETKEKISKNHADFKGGKHPRAKAVMCIETGRVYDCACNAARETNILQPSITRCCNGERKTAGGYHWKFIDSTKGVIYGMV